MSRSRFELRDCWILLRDGRINGVALDKRVAEQSEKNSRRFDKANNGAHEYEIVRSRVFTKQFVAPKGYDKENATPAHHGSR